MRTIGVVTVGRSDYGIYRPILKKIEQDVGLQLHLMVAGMHLLEKYGKTINEIRQDGFKINQEIFFSFISDQPDGVVHTMGAALQAFSQGFSQKQPDILLVLGDRFEMHAAALAALPFKIPVAHIHGGELTLGAIDNALRHSITMLSHLHFVAMEDYRKRVLQLGEEPWRVYCTGAPALDHFQNFKPVSLEALAQQFDLPLKEKPILVTFHPVTLEYENTERQIDQLLMALECFNDPIVFTGTNSDTNNSILLEKIRSFVISRPTAHLVNNFGPDFYFSMLSHAKVMVGNSSSGLIEAPSFRLPVVNIGSRQNGRVRAKNVIDVDCDSVSIKKGIEKAVSASFCLSLQNMVNPYYTGTAAENIVSTLKQIPLNQRLVAKSFIDIHGT